MSQLENSIRGLLRRSVALNLTNRHSLKIMKQVLAHAVVHFDD